MEERTTMQQIQRIDLYEGVFLVFSATLLTEKEGGTSHYVALGPNVDDLGVAHSLLSICFSLLDGEDKAQNMCGALVAKTNVLIQLRAQARNKNGLSPFEEVEIPF